MVWLQANWMQLLVGILAVDQILIGVFPQVPLFGSIAGILRSFVGGGNAPSAPK